MTNTGKLLRNSYYYFKRKWEVHRFNMYRKHYVSLSFEKKQKMAAAWLEQYPEQAHYNFEPVEYWLNNVVTKPVSVIEIGGWRGDLANKVLNENDLILHWHNYDLIENNGLQKCTDPRYKLITLCDYIWNTEPVSDYNSLISTHMIEHINWREFKKLTEWIPDKIETVLFEAPLPPDDENFTWKGDYSSHVLEKGWKQVNAEMSKRGFKITRALNNTVIYKR